MKDCIKCFRYSSCKLVKKPCIKYQLKLALVEEHKKEQLAFVNKKKLYNGFKNYIAANIRDFVQFRQYTNFALYYSIDQDFFRRKNDNKSKIGNWINMYYDVNMYTELKMHYFNHNVMNEELLERFCNETFEFFWHIHGGKEIKQPKANALF